MNPSYDPRQAHAAMTRELHGLDPEGCRYCGGETCVDAQGHAEREIAWGVYASLRDGLHDWLKDPITVPAGFYGVDHPEPRFLDGGSFDQ